MRWVDDYIFVSPSKDRTEAFIGAAHTKLRALGCFINPEKTLVNFHVAVDGLPLSRVKGDWIPWCGFFINTVTLEVKHNYLQYIGKLSVDWVFWCPFS